MDKNKIEQAFNKILCERYPFLIPRNRWTDLIPEDYNFNWTELDEMPPGWRKAFGIQMLEEIREELIKNDYLYDFRILQIKEKYGGLCFYVGGAPSTVHSIIYKYEDLSYKVCEFCGAPAKTEIDSWGWVTTWCKDCKERIENRNV